MASDTEYDNAWFGKLIGRRFLIHTEVQTAMLKVLAPTFAGLEQFANTLL